LPSWQPRTPCSRTAEPELRIGVLAVQGGFEAHLAILRRLGAEVREVRTPEDLVGIDGLVIPGGESTTISMGIDGAGLSRPIKEFHAAGGPVFGTCAGMIVCDDGHLGLIDATATRNAFGRQLHSFEADLEIAGIGDEPLRAIFIRAPWVERCGPGVEVLASYEGHPVAIREGSVLACAFHPELSDDPRLHALFMAMTTSAHSREEAKR
jgi:pyridoxal 5'-phosphate synthase pdxT subunit